MALSYVLYTNQTGVGPYNFTFPYISTAHIKVEKNGTVLTSGTDYTLSTSPTASITLTSALIATDRLRIYRETPGLQVSPNNLPLVDFNDGSVLTASDLDKNTQQLLYLVQESDDTGSGALGPSADESTWTAQSKRISEVADGLNAQDVVTMAQLTAATIYGGATTTPQVWAFTGTGSDVYALSPLPLSTTEEMFLVEVGGVIQHPDTYTIISNGVAASIDFDAGVAIGVPINIRNLGVARNINESVTTSMVANEAITNAKLATNAVTYTKIATNAVQTVNILNDNVTYAKIQNVSATDKVLGRATAGSGDIEEITCTAAGRALLDDATIADQRTTLGLGPLATKTTIVNSDVDSTALIDISKLSTLAADTVVGCGAVSGAPTALPCTAIGRSVISAADAAAARTVLGVNFLNGGSSVGSLVPIASTTAPAPGSTTLQALNASINAGNWLCVIMAYGGAGAFSPSKVSAGVIAYNAFVSTLPNVGGVLASGQNWGGFAIRVS